MRRAPARAFGTRLLDTLTADARPEVGLRPNLIRGPGAPGSKRRKRRSKIMGVLIDGQWTDNEEAPRRGGAFIRPAAAFRAFVAADGGSPFPAEAGRYHLYVANPCPWCHRTMIFRALKRLENVVSISFVDPLMLEGGWAFKEPDPITGARFVHELYTR